MKRNRKYFYHNIIKRINYFEINLTKEVQDLYSKVYQNFLKGILKENLSKWKATPQSIGWKIYHC